MVDPLQNQIPIKPDQILDILIRRKWILIIPLCIALTIGLFLTLTATKTYEASTFILVQPQRVPTQYVRSVVTSTIGQRINTISQQILSRSNLEKVIDQFGLYENSGDMYLEDKIESMRKRVKVKLERSRSRSADAFSIGFSGSDPQKVMRIANTLASYFMDENLKVREAQAVGTSEFLDSELEKTKKRLEERERALSEYRAKYLGGLPDELESNLRTLDRLQEQLSNKYTAMSEAKIALGLLETELSKKRELPADLLGDDDELWAQSEIGMESFSQSEDEEKLEAAQKEYDTILLKYTPKHPDAMKLQKVIEKLEISIKEAKAEEQTVEDDAIRDSIEQNVSEDVQVDMMILQSEFKIKQSKAEIKQIQKDIDKIEHQMKIYQQRVEETPKREQELKRLQRDYSNINEIFKSLLARQLESEISVNMEKKQKGEQFRILDHARLPERPISPNVKILFLLSLAAGLGLGGGIVFVLEFFDTSIRHDEQIEKELGLNIIATIPVMKVSRKKLKDKFELTFFICCALYASAFIAFFIVLNSKGLDRTINWIKMAISL